MYTLLVSTAASEQQHGPFRMDRNRFLEYTDDSIRTQLRPISVEAVACLNSWPCILMQEGRGDEVAHIGRVTKVSASPWEVTLDFEPIERSFVLTNDALWKLSSLLDIADFEFSRNHVAIKARDALDVLATAGYDVGLRARLYFPEKPLPATSRHELLRARDLIGEWGHTDIDDLLFEIGLPELGLNRNGRSRRDRANEIARFAMEHPEAVTAENSLLSAFLVRRALPKSPPTRTAVPEVAAERVAPEPSTNAQPRSRSPNRVFVVHGQNDDARTMVVKHLRDVGLEAIVLHDQPNMGRHLLTKFIQEADLVTFAVVLMTDDDVGCVKEGRSAPRARQNVILELGYFLSHLGQPRVCALITPGLETPSDFDGIVYIRMDADGNWHRELDRELVAARMPVKSASS
jgi:predicted nucleotide-binding protein